MDNIFIKILIALIVVVGLFYVIGPVFALLAIPNAATLIPIFKVCIGCAALIYIIR